MNDPQASARLADPVASRAIVKLEDLLAARTAELKTLAARIQLINEVARIGTWEWDLVADRHLWDSRLYALYGLHEEDGPPTYASWSARIHPDDLPGIEARLDALCSGQKDIARDEFRIRWPDGTERCLAEVCKIQRDGQTGAALRVYGISWDITDQRRAQDEVRRLNAELEARVLTRTLELEAATAALHQSEERFRYAMEATSDGIWDWNVATGTVYYSPGYARMLGYAQDELAPQMDTWLDLLHPEERAGVLVRAQHPLENSGYRELEFRMRTKAGGYRWVLSRGKVIERAADGTPRRVVGTHLDITERKETELELCRYRQIVEASTEKLFFLDRDLRYQVVNPAYAAMYHCNPEALRGRAMAQIAPPAIWAQVQPHLEAALAGEPQHFQMEATYPDGYTWYLEAQHQPFWEDGRVQGIVTSLHDLTRMRAVQAALEAEQAHLEARVAERTAQLQIVAERLQLATEAGGIGVFDMDMTTGQIVWDAKLRAVYGVPQAPPELSWQAWLEWVAPEHRGVLQDSFARILRGEETTFQGVVLVHCPDGQDRYIASRARFLEGTGGASRHLVGINWDVTAERQAVAALAASEAKARAVIDASPVPLAIADESGPVRYLNAAFVQTFGYTLEDIPTMDDWRRLAYPDPVERARILRQRQERMAQVAREGGTCEPLEVSVRRKDGTVRTVITRATLLGGEERLNTLYDITDLKQAQTAAEQAARAKSDFLAHMSHEIRTPLNGVLGLAQVLSLTALDPDQRALLEKMRTAGRSLLAILNDILDLSKIEAGRLSLEARPFDLVALLAAIGDLLGPTARDKGLTLTMAVPPEVTGGLLGDPVRLEQVLVNLIGNAIKFTDHGEVRLRIDPLEVTAAGVRLRFEVTDTGIGMTPAARAGIFAPFTQADASITRRFGGTGLGLSICKRLVELMGGEIGAESQEGLGSTFWVEVPFARTAQPLPLPSAPTPAPTSAQVPAGPRLAGLHLLVVDDGAMNRLVAERMLAMEGARTTLAVDGQAALDCLRAEPQDFDAVLMDMQMPVVDGLTATRLIRTELGLTDLPIIALTAGVLPAQQEAALASGMNAVLTKPLDLERMVALVAQWVRPRPGVVPRVSPAPGLLAQTDGPADEEFPQVAGIDRASAARLLAGNRTLFLDLLERFAQEFAGVVATTRQALAAGDLVTAARQMHTLKGGAGTLAALDLSEAAELLEGAIERGATDLDERLAALDRGITALIATGLPWRRGATAPLAATQAAQPAMDAQRLNALRAALRTRNLDAFDDFEALQPWLYTALGEEACAAVERAIRSLDFPGALARLDQALAQSPSGSS
ncbi:PAS domain-containing protein [uncultured Thiodictyon sp.]|uniref:PAS domain-containing hybrid sensor histidine kinase/response regulator n=1 Tax=uncultured Thiodictyon sp. TaxID=1846217 RepID=UPI0025D393A8|nr:PAS domain-containing protein [uncultured Thiodictyon sp.]